MMMSNNSRRKNNIIIATTKPPPGALQAFHKLLDELSIDVRTSTELTDARQASFLKSAQFDSDGKIPFSFSSDCLIKHKWFGALLAWLVRSAVRKLPEDNSPEYQLVGLVLLDF